MPALPLFEDPFLRAQWRAEFDAFEAWAKLANISARTKQQHAITFLHPGAKLEVTNTDDEILLHINGREARHLFDKPNTSFLAAQRRNPLRDQNATESYDAKRLLKQLLTLRQTTEEPLKQRILALAQEITALKQITYNLYDLTNEDMVMILNN